MDLLPIYSLPILLGHLLLLNDLRRTLSRFLYSLTHPSVQRVACGMWHVASKTGFTILQFTVEMRIPKGMAAAVYLWQHFAAPYFILFQFHFASFRCVACFCFRKAFKYFKRPQNLCGAQL